MEDLSCSILPSSNIICIPTLSQAQFQQNNRHCHFLVTSQQRLIAFHLSSRELLKPTQWLASVNKRAKTFALVTTGTDVPHTDGNANLAQNTIVCVDVQTERHSPLATSALDTGEEALALPSNAQLSLSTKTDCVHGNVVTDVSNASELSEVGEANYAHHVHAPVAQSQIPKSPNEEKILHRKRQQLTYLFAALASTAGITSLAGASVYYRFAWQMEGSEVPWIEMFGTFSLALGAAVGMEYWARWAHRALWHASLWNMHESHHQPRDGPFEVNDVFAIINAVPAIALMAFGFLHKGLVPGLCFGAGLGITVYGIAYMFVHDGLVHRRFPVGPIADVPYFQRVAAAHQLHHADRFNGVPYGLFLGPMELENIGGQTELEELLKKRRREKTNPIKG